MGNKQGQSQNPNEGGNPSEETVNQELITKQRLEYLNKMAAEQSTEKKEDEINLNEKASISSNKMVIDDEVIKSEIKDTLFKNKSNIPTNISNNIQKDEKITNANISLKSSSAPTDKPKKEIDLEHVTIEKMFKVTLEKEKGDKLRFIDSYLQSLNECNKELKFRVGDLDNLIITLIDIEKSNIVNYLLTTFHRGYELIEVRFKKELAEKFSDSNRLLISYFSMIITSPENFDLELKYEDIEASIAKYFEETKEKNEEELLYFFTLCFQANEDNNETLRGVFNFIINIINRQNVKCYIETKANVSRKNI